MILIRIEGDCRVKKMWLLYVVPLLCISDFLDNVTMTMTLTIKPFTKYIELILWILIHQTILFVVISGVTYG